MIQPSDIEQPFRTLQAISDLRAVVRAAPGTTLTRLASGVDIPNADTLLRSLIFQDGCQFTSPDTLKLHQKLVLAAALPNDDFDAFQIATALLLADRLQRGLGSDDLYWHWDAFQEHYALSPAHIRASVMHGFRRMQIEGLVVLADPPRGSVLLTETREAVDSGLSRETGTRALAIRSKLGSDEVTADFWTTYCAPELDPSTTPAPAIVRGIRYLFETHLDWNPPRGTDRRLIPLIAD